MGIKCVESFKAIRKCDTKRVVINHLNITALRNIFDSLIKQITGNRDILIISDGKLDSSFSMGEFLINGDNEPLRIDWNSQGLE